MSIKIALCLSGHMRSYKQCLENYKENIFSKFDVDVFIHTWDRNPNYDLFQDKIIDTQEIINLYKQAGASNVFIFIETADSLDNIEDMSKNKIMEYWKTDNKICHINLIYQYYKIYKVHKMKREYELENNIIYDIVIRSRPDIIFNNKVDINVNDYITI